MRQSRVVLVEAVGHRFGQRRDLDPHAAPGQLGEHLRIPFASDQRANLARAETVSLSSWKRPRTA
jgi:hypothetical protein